MSLGVCLLFDGRSDPAVRNLWDQLEEKGVSGLFQDRWVRPDTPGLRSGGMGTECDDC